MYRTMQFVVRSLVDAGLDRWDLRESDISR